MKKNIKNIIAIVFILLTGTTLKAQDAKYIGAMQSGLKMFSEAKTGADYVAASNQFERIGTQVKTEWLPFYYAAYTQLINNTTLTNTDEKDAAMDKAQELIDKAEAINPKESEIFSMKGYIKFMKIYVNPMARMQSGMGAAITDLETAKALNPANPRPYFILAQNAFYTPEAFGGGKNVAKPKFTEAAAKFDAFKTSNPMMPNWGVERNASLLVECK
ncbi:hypothetical protein A5893_10800 [Pedobacter psychrophilus]|uniref:Tetratricopeptide repeat protein n=1 Tax=Pedobacter psychrophilus TaxID=1826909 RepID=A0A179DDN4_9SPHI|nr:hypothetical protein [Pedobacter psychrophilus]OAQ39146.1 hypothetical protein A5893_10800 [Pedobacter psychrophilus]